MPFAPEPPAGWLAPQWLVAGVALAAVGLLLSYDLRLGLAAAVLVGAIAIGWLAIALRYGSLSGASPVRVTLIERARTQERLRRLAAARMRRRPDERA